MSGISKSQVSRLCAEIDEKVKAFLTRPIEGDWPYLWIDATCVKVRQNGRIISISCHRPRVRAKSAAEVLAASSRSMQAIVDKDKVTPAGCLLRE